LQKGNFVQALKQLSANICYDGPNRPFSCNWRPMLIYEGPISTYAVQSYLLHTGFNFLNDW